MQSLQIMEGLIGAACALACVYYARGGTFAAQPAARSAAATVPWHSALGEFARRNPFAAVFGALAFGFLASSWMMYVAPRAIALPPRTVEKLRTITRIVPTPDPAQTARIDALQTIINANAATITSQKTEIDGLKRLLAKAALDSANMRRDTFRPQAETNGETFARPTEANAIAPPGTTAGATTRANPPSAAPEANGGATTNPQPSGQSNVTAPANGPAVNAPASTQNTNTTPQNAPGTVPH